MQATLIYNPSAGSTNSVTAEKLVEALGETGYHPIYKATSKEEDLDMALADAAGLVVVAGGDGSVRSVATRLIGKKIALSVLPLGTANNIARTLGVQGSPLEIIAGLKEPQKRHFDLGYVRSPWGADYFLEGAGFGLFAEALAAYRPEEGKSIIRGINSVAQLLANFESHSCRAVLDGEDVSGRYILFEVLNTTAIGPRLKLAPDADPADGLFQVVRVREDVRDSLALYIANLINETFAKLPSVEVSKCRRVEIEWTGFHFHVDGEVRPGSNKRPQEDESAPGARPADGTTEKRVIVEILPQALELWLPRQGEDSSQQAQGRTPA